MPKDYVAYQGSTKPSATNQNNEAGQNAPKMVGWQAIASDELVSEFMLNALRLHEGVTWVLFEARTNLNYSAIAGQVDKLIGQGLLEDSKDKLQPTALGQRYLNQILREFL